MSNETHHPDPDPTKDLPSSSLDYHEDHNVTDIHESILREKADPQEGQEPMALWVIALICITIAWGGFYLGTYSGGFRADVYDERAGGGLGGSGSSSDGAAKEEVLDPMVVALRAGRRAYTSNCASCHQATGQGVAGQYPTLAGSSRVLGPDKKLVALVLHGYNGPVYSAAMPAQQTLLSDAQIANILTFVRQEWGNQANPITEEEVAAIRAEFAGRVREWSTEELDALP